MDKCPLCQSPTQMDLINEVFSVAGRVCLVQKIPVANCHSCGQSIFSREVTENIRKMLQEEGAAGRLVTIEAFTYQP